MPFLFSCRYKSNVNISQCKLTKRNTYTVRELCTYMQTSLSEILWVCAQGFKCLRRAPASGMFDPAFGHVDHECGHVESCLFVFAISRGALCAPRRLYNRVMLLFLEPSGACALSRFRCRDLDGICTTRSFDSFGAFCLSIRLPISGVELSTGLALTFFHEGNRRSQFFFRLYLLLVHSSRMKGH